MAVGKNRSDGPRTDRRAFGSYKLTGGENQATQVTVPSGLDDYPFPNEVGQRVKVEHVDDPERGAYLELIPVEEDGGDSA